MPEDLKIITFSKENLNGLESLRPYTKNELVRGLLDIVLRNRLANREFYCNDERFKRILNELIEEYQTLRQKAQSNKIKDADAELEKLIVNINTMLKYIFQELRNEKPSEINLSTYLVRLSRYTNDIETKYSNIIWPEHKSMLQRLRESKLTKWIIGGAAGVSLMGGMYAASVNKDASSSSNNVNSNKIEVKAEVKKENSTNTKNMTVAEMNKKIEADKKAELMKITVADIYRASKNAKVPIPTPPGYEFLFMKKDALVTAYNPTGPGLMAGFNPDGTPYEETGRTSTNFDATQNYKGVAVDPKIIPYGSLIYIEGVGWRIADDTGDDMHESWDDARIVHIDLRKRGYKEALIWGNPRKKIYVFKNISGKNYYNRVLDARKAFANKDSKIFKHITANK